jgi:hypothetical protein
VHLVLGHAEHGRRRRGATAARRRAMRSSAQLVLIAWLRLVSTSSLHRESVLAGLQAAQRLLQRLLEGAADGHDLAHRLHLGGQSRIGLRELLEIKPRHLGDHIVDGGLERGRRGAAGDLVAQLVQGVADGELGRHLGDRKAGGLGRQRRGTRHARVHLDDDHAPVFGIDGELDVGAAGVDADLAQHGQRGVAHDLVFLVGQRLRRRDGDGVAGVHAHGIEVFDGADDDAVVVACRAPLPSQTLSSRAPTHRSAIHGGR